MARANDPLLQGRVGVIEHGLALEVALFKSSMRVALHQWFLGPRAKMCCIPLDPDGVPSHATLLTRLVGRRKEVWLIGVLWAPHRLDIFVPIDSIRNNMLPIP